MKQCHAAAFLGGLLQQSSDSGDDSGLSVWKWAESAGRPGLDVSQPPIIPGKGATWLHNGRSIS